MTTDQLTAPLVSVDWLLANDEPDVRILDATWQSRASGKDPRADFCSTHLPQARFFDHAALASLADGPFCDTRPDREHFARHMSALGIRNGDHVIVYSQKGTAGGASRAWWLLRSFGHDNVSVLDGGLPAWQAAEGATESGEATITPADYRVPTQSRLVISVDELSHAIARREVQVVDARPAAYFEGRGLYDSGNASAPPITPGRMPRSVNLPSSSVVDSATRQMLAADEIRALLAERGVRLDEPLVTTCSLGIGACTAALALAVAGAPAARVFDGAWEVWGSHPDTVKIQ